MDAPIAYLNKNKDVFLEDLKELINIPSVSGASQHRADMHKCADVIVSQLKKAGLGDARVLESTRNTDAPLVYASSCAHPDKPTVLIYGHYDVVAVENKLLWETEPFQATVKDGYVFGRGSSDDKGQFSTSIKAVESLLKSEGALPINIKFILEGEEETSSNILEAALADDAIVKLLSNNAIFISDGPWFAEDVPTIMSGVRGICDLEINIKGPKLELHSGLYGGAVANPVNVLVEMLSTLWDRDGRISIPGFYDSVLPSTAEEQENIQKLPFDAAKYMDEIGVPALRGEKGFSAMEHIMCRPSLDIIGIWGGFAGVGPKSAIPPTAGAKVSVRLVADQDEKEVQGMIRRHLESICPPAASMELKFFSGGNPYLLRSDEPMIGPAREALKQVFGKEPVFVRCGGSLPIVTMLNQKLNSPIIMCDIGFPSDNVHSNNEKFLIDQFMKGIEMYIRLFSLMGSK